MALIVAEPFRRDAGAGREIEDVGVDGADHTAPALVALAEREARPRVIASVFDRAGNALDEGDQDVEGGMGNPNERTGGDLSARDATHDLQLSALLLSLPPAPCVSAYR